MPKNTTDKTIQRKTEKRTIIDHQEGQRECNLRCKGDNIYNRKL